MPDRLQTALDQLTPVEGLTLTDVLDLPEPISTAITTLIRRGPLSAPELAAALDLPPAQARTLAEQLAAKGYIHAAERDSDGATVYTPHHARHARPRPRPSDLWAALDDL